jgi:hypothetical protein
MKAHVVKNILFILVTVISLTSCYTVSTYYLSILEPAEITMPPGIRNISVYPGLTVNKSVKGELDSLNNIRFDPDVNYYEYCYGYYDGLAEILEYSPRFDSIVITDSILVSSIDRTKEFSWNDIIRICKEDSTDAIVILESFYLKDYLDIENFFGFECYVAFLIESYSSWKIYYPEEFKIIDKYISIDTIKWIGLDFYCDNALNNLPQHSDMISESSYWAGKKYGSRIAPLWYDNVKRIYYSYSSGNKNMHTANTKVKMDQWQDAAELWRSLTDHPNKRLASRACFNMALACEVEDKLELAYEWAKKSKRLNNSTRTDEYIKIIEKRLGNEQKLDEQMLNN